MLKCQIIGFFWSLSLVVACGKPHISSTKYYRGIPVDNEQFDTVVKIETAPNQICSGVFIGPHTVLSCASCFFRMCENNQVDGCIESEDIRLSRGNLTYGCLFYSKFGCLHHAFIKENMKIFSYLVE